jgi:2,4-dienoyl-CoA reductase-like NADH-dependent reductase (Old Yellow Enzyme family)
MTVEQEQRSILNDIPPSTKVPRQNPGKSIKENSSQLFSSFHLNESLALKNRFVVSPMCQYSAIDGLPNKWHLLHYAQFAIRGAGLIMVESTAVTPHGRITPNDLGLWNDAQREAFKEICDTLNDFHAVAGIQLGHAGRKASAMSPFKTGNQHFVLASEEEGGWPKDVVAPSAIAWDELALPREMTITEIQELVESYAVSARRAVEAGKRALIFKFFFIKL